MKNNRLPLTLNSLLTLVLISSLAFFACQKKIEQDLQQGTPLEKIAPDGFAFVTSKTVAVNITVQTNTNQPLKGVPLSVYTIKSKGVLGDKIFTGFSDASGRFIANISVPAAIDTLIIDPKYIGLIKNAKAVITNNSITGTIGGSKTFTGAIVGSMSVANPAAERNYVRSNSNGVRGNATINGVTTNTVFSYLSPYDADGRPTVMEPNDAIEAEMVTDLLDEFPNDSRRAYTNYYPSKTTWASIAFEDQWPVSGDYDLNDLVVKYQYKWVSSGSNEVVDLYGSFAPIASGATFQNGFGVQLPFAANKIQSVTGYRHTDNYIRLNANGTEASQTNAVIVPFDNCRSLIRPVSAASPMINTDMSLAKVTGDTVRLTIALASPISNASFGAAPFNPFIICDKKRGFEVHLPGMLPTDLIDRTQFGKGVDNTTPASNIYFVTKQNYPWALNFMDNFVYPVEQQSIGNAYLKFFGWAASGGRDYRDWNTNTASGYRSNSLLFTK